MLARGIAACFGGGGVPGVPLSQAEPSIYRSSPERNEFPSGRKAWERKGERQSGPWMFATYSNVTLWTVVFRGSVMTITLPKAQRTRGLSSYYRISIKHQLQNFYQTSASQVNLKLKSWLGSDKNGVDEDLLILWLNESSPIESYLLIYCISGWT